MRINSKSFCVIGDVAGNFKELKLLLRKLPQDADIILAGDLNDRGPDTKEVIQWAIDNKILAVHSNHGDMFTGYYNRHHKREHSSFKDIGGRRDSDQIFLINGGHETLISYGGIDNVPQEHIDWLMNLPWYIETDDCIITHGPIPPHTENISSVIGYEKAFRSTILWNRESPTKRDKIQIFGHNTYHTIYYGDEDKAYAYCIDNCGEDELMAIHYPSMQIYKQEYLK